MRFLVCQTLIKKEYKKDNDFTSKVTSKVTLSFRASVLSKKVRLNDVAVHQTFLIGSTSKRHPSFANWNYIEKVRRTDVEICRYSMYQPNIYIESTAIRRALSVEQEQERLLQSFLRHRQTQ